MGNNKEKHLDVYDNRYELHQDDVKIVFKQGFQNEETKKRYDHINESLSNGYLEVLYDSIQETDFSELSDVNKALLKNMVNGFTSEQGRALVGLAFLQLTIKSIAPEQCIRLHKGTTRTGSFSWVEGISMRTLDSHYNTPFLRKHGLIKINKDGLFMTRSLAENYPYTSLYKAKMEGPFDVWINIVDAIESEDMPAKLGLLYLMTLLKNRSEEFQTIANEACSLVKNKLGMDFSSTMSMIKRFFDGTDYSARAFEVSMHSLFQAMEELDYLDNVQVVPMSQMRSANKKHGNIGDIELKDHGIIIESWDAKYGKPYLRDEMEELRDKLITNPNVKIAGFVAYPTVDRRNDVTKRAGEIELELGIKIYLYTFDEWVDYKTCGLSSSQKNQLGFRWLVALVESFAQKRLELAPIDEPCDAWIRDLINILK